LSATNHCALPGLFELRRELFYPMFLNIAKNLPL
jgi:hypothetical protein